jgi:hypothetical protein
MAQAFDEHGHVGPRRSYKRRGRLRISVLSLGYVLGISLHTGNATLNQGLQWTRIHDGATTAELICTRTARRSLCAYHFCSTHTCLKNYYGYFKQCWRR